LNTLQVYGITLAVQPGTEKHSGWIEIGRVGEPTGQTCISTGGRYTSDSWVNGRVKFERASDNFVARTVLRVSPRDSDKGSDQRIICYADGVIELL
jgi:hypothetical protein